MVRMESSSILPLLVAFMIAMLALLGYVLQHIEQTNEGLRLHSQARVRCPACRRRLGKLGNICAYCGTAERSSEANSRDANSSEGILEEG
jgi:hypothetical protein